MMHVGPIPPDMIEKIIQTVRDMLANPTVQISISRGIFFWNDYGTGTVQARPTEGRTLTIEVNGGAAEVHESPMDELARLRKEIE